MFDNNNIKFLDGKLEEYDEDYLDRLIHKDYDLTNKYLIEKYEINLDILYDRKSINVFNIEEMHLNKVNEFLDKQERIIKNSLDKINYNNNNNIQSQFEVIDKNMLDNFIKQSSKEILENINIIFSNNIKDELVLKKNENNFYIGELNDPDALIHFIDEESIIIDHTYVSEKLRGKGVAGILLDEVIKYAKESNKKIIPVCSYAKEKLASDKYKDIVVNN